MKVYALDIGGSSIKHALLECHDGAAQVLQRFEPLALSARTFEALRTQLLTGVRSHAPAASGVRRIGISTTGFVTPEGIVVKAGAFVDYENVHWRQQIKSVAPHIESVAVMNDGRASAWAEYQGVREHCAHFAHVVVGTGIGAGLVVHQKLLLGEQAAAGDIAHLKLTRAPTLRCYCGQQGCLEALASARAMLEAYRGAAPSGSEVREFAQLIERAAEADATAIKTLKVAGEWLGVAISLILTLLNPGVLTVGGGVIEATARLADALGRDPYFQSAREVALTQAHPWVSTVKILRARHGNEGGVIGAALAAAAANPVS